MAKLEEEYQDVLQNIEAGIVMVYRKDGELVDYDVEKAIDALIRVYQAEQRRREPPPVTLTPERVQSVYDSVRSMCEWRLGRATMERAEGRGGAAPQLPPISLDVIIACLKRIRKSVRFWTKKAGYQGYLSFVSRFV